MNFNTETTYTKERLMRFNTFVFMRRKFTWISALFLAVLLSVPFFRHLFAGEFSRKYFWCFIIVWCWSLLYFLYRLVWPRLTIDKNPRLNVVVKYEFCDSYFKISSPSHSFPNSPEISYDLIQNVFLYKNDLYIYFSGNQLFIMDTQAFEADTRRKFFEFLEEKDINVI